MAAIIPVWDIRHERAVLAELKDVIHQWQYEGHYVHIVEDETAAHET